MLFLPLVHVCSQPSPANDWWNSSAHYGINNCTGTLITTSDWISPWSHSHLMAKPVKASVGTLTPSCENKVMRTASYPLSEAVAKTCQSAQEKKEKRRDEMRCKPWHLSGRVWVGGRWGARHVVMNLSSYHLSSIHIPPFWSDLLHTDTCLRNHFRTSVIWLALNLPVKYFSCWFFMNTELLLALVNL